MNPQLRQGFVLSRRGQNYYGLIVNVTNEDVEYVSVDEIIDDLGHVRPNYDDRNAVYETDRNNVYLKDCPPPFSDLSLADSKGNDVNNAYAVADMSNVRKMSRFDFDAIAHIIDNGEKISERDMRIVKSHSWPRQSQKEKSYREIPYFEDDKTSDLDFSL